MSRINFAWLSQASARDSGSNANGEFARIDPTTGEVVGLINLAGLLPEEDRLRDTDVLNGIAIDPATGSIWVTGKRWPWLFEITLENEAD